MRDDVNGDKYEEGGVCRDAQETRKLADARGRSGLRLWRVLLLISSTAGRSGGGESEDDALGYARRNMDGERKKE